MITVLGASDFIGSYLVKKLREAQLEYFAPGQDDLPSNQLGNIKYCIGLAGDFKSCPVETVEAHVCKLLQVVRLCEFESLLFVSSTRVYKKRTGKAREEDVLHVASLNPGDLYKISKAMGESLALAREKKGRVVRLSNVYVRRIDRQEPPVALRAEGFRSRLPDLER